MLTLILTRLSCCALTILQITDLPSHLFPGGLVPIKPIQRQLQDNRHGSGQPLSSIFQQDASSSAGSRYMLPLTLGYSTTIHHCQGMSLSLVATDFGLKDFVDGLIYVGCSRVTDVDNLAIITSMDLSAHSDLGQNALWPESLAWSRLLKSAASDQLRVRREEVERLHRQHRATMEWTVQQINEHLLPAVNAAHLRIRTPPVSSHTTQPTSHRNNTVNVSDEVYHLCLQAVELMMLTTTTNKLHGL